MQASTRLIDGLARRASRLFSLPNVVVRVLELTDQAQVDYAALRACIEMDPVLTTKVLRVVNSSLFGLRRPVSNLSQALALLGAKPLKLLVLGFSLPAGLFSGIEAETLRWYWRRTLTKAVAAREICETIRQGSADEAFVAALLQDLGMLLLIQELGAPYASLIDKARHNHGDLLALEVAALGFDHTTLTAVLMADWKLPPGIVDAIAWDPRTEAETPLPAAGQFDLNPAENAFEYENRLVDLGSVVHLAEWIARFLADGRPDAVARVLEIGQRDFKLTPDQLNAMITGLEQKVAGLAEGLSLELSEAVDLRELLATAHLRLAELAAEAAGDLLRAAVAPPRLDAEVQMVSEAASRWSSEPMRSPCRVNETESGVIPAAISTASPGLSTPGRMDRGARLPAAPAANPSATRSVARGDQAAGPRGNERTANLAGDGERGLLAHLTTAVAICRQSRCTLSLMLVELSQPDELVLGRGIEEFRRVRSRLEAACRCLDHGKLICVDHGEAGFAVILKGCDRQLAVRLGNSLIERFARLAPAPDLDQKALISISVGVAAVNVPPRNFPASDLIEAADRCLYGSRASGGGVVKSIEIY